MMSAKDKKKDPLVPRLRFPEFRDAGEWECAQMGDIYAFKKNNSFSRDMLNYNAGDVKNIHYGDIHKKFSSHFYAENENIPFVNCNINLGSISEDCLCTAGDIIFADASEDMKDIGKCIEIISNNKERILSGLHTIFTRQFSSTLVIGFGGHLFQSPRVRAQIQKEAQGTKILGISSGRLAKISISFPFAKGEQQKIADCLSSLDERIAAETNKLDALKAHKSGLLKQLFPAEGETLPALRFPEFRSAGEWEERTLSQLGELVSGLTYSPDDVRDNGLLVLRSSNVQNGMIVLDDNVYVRHEIGSANPSEPNDILICVRNGSKSLIGKNALIPEGMPPCTHGAFMMVFRSRSAKFVIQLFQTETYESQVSAGLGATINSINGNQLKKYKFFVPKPAEQQKIADCLSSLDELIAAQRQKLSLLKTHKKGLMQQLFPVFDEAKA